MILREAISVERIRNILEEVYDPEIPVLSIFDLGIVRDIHVKEDEIEIVITPTYSGCPAMDVIGMNIRMALFQNGFKNIKITQQLSPAWTTDWMTETGKAKLKSYGIAPPQTSSGSLSTERLNKLLFPEELHVECPLCHSTNTRLLSQFGSTACKALYQCNDCKEPFDYFKCH